MLELFATSGLVSAIIAFVFGLVVLLKDWRHRPNQLFFLLIIAFIVWAFSYWRWLLSEDSESALFWVKLLAAGTMLTPVLFTDWVTTLFGRRARYAVLLTVLYILALVTIILLPTELIVLGVREKLGFPFWPDAGPGYLLSIVILYVGALIPAFYELIKPILTLESGPQRGQAIYILLGALLGFGGGYTNVFLWFDIPVIPYGTVFTSFFPFLLAYAVIKHRLFNLKAIASELLVVFISGVLLVELILSKTPVEFTLRSMFFVMSTVLGYVLIRSVYREVEQRLEIERLARDLRAANEKLKELDKLKSQFLSIATHELRTPLTIVRNFISLMLDGSYGKVPPAIEESGRQVFSRVTDMARSVDTYLNVSRIEQGKMKYDFMDANLTELVEQAVEAMKPNVEKKKLALTLMIKSGAEKLLAHVDGAKITEVVTNLLDNSIKYTPEGSIQVSLEKVGSKARFTIQDTGVGMSPETMAGLFKLFSPGEDSKKINPASTGVGLYISRAHIEAHKGTLTASSQGVGKGSRFVIDLPLIS